MQTGEQAPARRFLAAGAGALAALVLALVGAHLVLDPYGFLGAGAGDAPKPAINRHERVSRALAANGSCARTLVLGSSRALHGLDPRAFAASPEGAYNFGIGSPSLDTVGRFLRMATARCTPEVVVVGLDFAMFNGHKRDLDREFERFEPGGGVLAPARRWATLAGAMFSPASIPDLWATIRARGAPALRDATGTMTDAYYAQKIGRLGGVGASFDDEVAGYPAYLAPPAMAFDLDGGLRAFDALTRQARERGLRPVYVILPLHAYEKTGIHLMGLDGLRERWLRELTRRLGDTGTALVDCSPFSGVETEPVPAARAPGGMQHWWESSHFRRSVGSMVAAQWRTALSGTPGSLCSRLDAGNVEGYLEASRQRATAWRQSNPGDVRRIRERLAPLLPRRPLSPE